MGGVIDEKTQKALFHLTDADNGGSICIDEFIQLIKNNEFDTIMGDHNQLEFIYQTHLNFQSIDDDKNGELSWDEFYFYLIKKGYSHKQISDHWHFLNVDKDSKVTFDEFWKGYKTMANNFKNEIDDEKEKEIDAKKKQKLKKVSHKMNESEFKVKVGKVVENENDDQKD